MKYFGLLAAALMMTISASASTVVVTCSVAGANGASSFALSALSCAQLTAAQLGANTLNSVTIEIEDGFSQGHPPGPNVFDFNYSSIDPDVFLLNGPPPNTCVTAGTGSATTCVDVLAGTPLSATLDYQLGNVITTDLAAYIGSGSFLVANVSANPDSGTPGSSILPSGQLGVTALVTYSYSTPSTGAPEPGSMMLLGGGLLAAGLIGRKKLVRK